MAEKRRLEKEYSNLEEFVERRREEQETLLKKYRVTNHEQSLTIQDLDKQKTTLKQLVHQLSNELETTKEEVYHLEKENNGLKKDKLIEQEKGREALEERREAFRKEMNAYRDRTEEEQVITETKFQRQL